MSFDLESLDDAWVAREADGKRMLMMLSGGNDPPPIGSAMFGLMRPASDNGLPLTLGGTFNMVGDYSTTEKDFYIEALENERLAVRRVLVHMYVSTQDITPGTYGNVPALTDGIQLYQKIFIEGSPVILAVLDGLPIKKQEDWGRISYDARPVGPYGPTSKTPFWQVRLTFTKFVDPRWGIILEEGEQLGVRLSDDFTNGGTDPLLEHYAYFEGSHLGIPNPVWQTPSLPLP